jgi:putative nucleotidyltransferase with HDIG domain
MSQRQEPLPPIPLRPEPTKPLAPELLRQLVDALAERAEQGALDLPVLADAAQRVMQLALEERTDAETLAKIIEQDLALSGHLLRVTNSPLYRGRSPIVSLQHAVSRLGMRQVRGIALAIVCETRIFKVRGFENELRDLFRHSLAAAHFAQEIARVKEFDPEEAFLAGLLHDIGRPVLLQTVVDLQQELGLSAPKATALAVVGTAHARVGARLVARWALPSRLSDAIHHHHLQTGPVSGVPLFAVISLADELAHLALATRPTDESSVRGSPRLAVLRITDPELDHLLGQRAKIEGAVAAMS